MIRSFINKFISYGSGMAFLSGFLVEQNADPLDMVNHVRIAASGDGIGDVLNF